MTTERVYLKKEPAIKIELNFHTCRLGYANSCCLGSPPGFF
jgi:hypothetical protein